MTSPQIPEEIKSLLGKTPQEVAAMFSNGGAVVFGGDLMAGPATDGTVNEILGHAPARVGYRKHPSRAGFQVVAWRGDYNAETALPLSDQHTARHARTLASFLFYLCNGSPEFVREHADLACIPEEDQNRS